MRVVMGSGLGRIRLFPRLLRIPCGFVFFSSIAPPRCPRAVPSRAHPIPSRFVPSYPPIPLDCFAPITLIAITPRLPCRVSGAYFLKASNSMPLTSELWSGSPYCLLTVIRVPCRPVGSSHHLIEMRLALPCLPPPNSITVICLLTDGIAAPITPRQSPRPSCRRTGRMCFDVIGCHAVDTVDMR